MDEVFERINRAAIQASTDLATESGCYAAFEGSDWQTGAYFTKRGYTSEAWQHLAVCVMQHKVCAMPICCAIAPTSSTSILAGTTAGIDPCDETFLS